MFVYHDVESVALFNFIHRSLPVSLHLKKGPKTEIIPVKTISSHWGSTYERTTALLICDLCASRSIEVGTL